MMQVAEILSDLTSLRACAPADAMALVRASQAKGAPSQAISSSPASPEGLARAKHAVKGTKEEEASGESDPDVQKVLEFIDLHQSIRSQYTNNRNTGLERARQFVASLKRDFGVD